MDNSREKKKGVNKVMATYANCSLCGGKVTEKRVKVDYWWKENLIIIEDVPAGVCERCGEEYYKGKVAEEMEKLALAKEKAKRLIKVPVMEYKQAV